MIRQNTTATGLSYQADLFNPNPVARAGKQPASGRPEPLEELALTYGDVPATARKYRIAKQEIYHVVFADGTKPLVLTVALRPNGKDFWTSIPEGRQTEAEQIGALIDHATKA